MVELPEILQDPVSRRTFLVRMSAAGLGTAAAVLLAGCGGSSNNGGGSNSGGAGGQANPTVFPGIAGQTPDVVVLNFALTLEHMEADLYRQVANIATGQNLPFGGNNVYANPQLVIPSGGLDPIHQAAGLAFLTQYAAVEAAHRDFLHDLAIPKVAGGTPVPPNPGGYAVPASVTQNPTLLGILTFLQQVEEEGVRAYSGAAGYLSNTALTQVAATIFTTEARHSAGLNYALGKDAGPMTGASGGSTDTQIVPVDGTTVSDNTLEKVKTPKQVLGDVRPFFLTTSGQPAIKPAIRKVTKS